MQLSFILLALIFCVAVAFADVRLGKYDPSARSVPFSPPKTKRGLASPFVFNFATTTTQEVKDCFNEAGNVILASLIDLPRSILVRVNWTTLDPSVLGSCRPAGSCTVRSSQVYYPAALADIVRDISDVLFSNSNACPLISDPDAPNDMIATFNSGTLGDGTTTWDFSADGSQPISPDSVDLVTIILHEMLHGLGFTTLFQQNSTGSVGLYSNPRFPSPFDTHLTLGTDQSNLIYPKSQPQQQADLTSGNVKFFLDDVTPTEFISMESPNPWEQGSSIAHYIAPDTDNTLMTASITSGVRIRYPGTVALRIIRAVGYTLTATALSPGGTTSSSATTAPPGTTSSTSTTAPPQTNTQTQTDTPTSPPDTSGATSGFVAVALMLIVQCILLFTM